MNRDWESTRFSSDATRLLRWFENHDRVAVAFSGGVDSSVVLAAACGSGADVIALTASSPSVAQWQRSMAERVAGDLDVEHRYVRTDELSSSAYVANESDRCFHCKASLYAALKPVCEEATGQARTVVTGTNSDDLGDYRPGIEAGRIANVATPLAELRLGKSDVRSIAAEFGLPNADLPASPCLASRLAYGVEVTAERLMMVERAEDYLREQGFETLRVRLHAGELARIELPAESLTEFLNSRFRATTLTRFQEIGFRYITFDLAGFQSGSMNKQLVGLSAPNGARLDH
ncbi:MAG: ATP-dependent sacrificial sulfur transferase LarE [Planctomycetota bacterium]